MRLVQQPSSTCWQLSTTSPVPGSSYDEARPPRYGTPLEEFDVIAGFGERASGGETGESAANDGDRAALWVVRALAHARRTNPFAMTASFSAELEPDALGEDVVVARDDLLQQAAIDFNQRPQRGLAVFVDQRQQFRRRGVEILARAALRTPAAAASRWAPEPFVSA